MKQDEPNYSLMRKEEPVFTFKAGLFEYLLVGIPAAIFFLMLLQHPDPAGFVLLVAGGIDYLLAVKFFVSNKSHGRELSA